MGEGINKTWVVVDEATFAPPTTFEELIALDQKHYSIGLGNLWMVSKRRAELLRNIRGRLVTMREIPVTIYQDGERVEVGTASLSSDGSGNIISHITLKGEYALGILQEGTPSFSIGMPPVEATVVTEISGVLPTSSIKKSRQERRGGKSGR
jgi:hypothetical protein